MAAVSTSPPLRELDELTMARAGRGDRAASRALVVMYEARVFTVLSRMLSGRGFRDRVEDLAQETFLRVFKNIDRFDAHGSARLSTWILTIATRLAIDELRKVRPLFDREAEPALVEDSPEIKLGRSERLRQVEEIASRLDPKIRAAFVLRVFHELSYEEIAEVLEVEVGTVKSRISRARAAFREAMRESSGEWR